MTAIIDMEMSQWILVCNTVSSMASVAPYNLAYFLIMPSL
jgi:hypothetical protein